MKEYLVDIFLLPVVRAAAGALTRMYSEVSKGLENAAVAKI
jgi:hypothetical protein